MGTEGSDGSFAADSSSARPTAARMVEDIVGCKWSLAVLGFVLPRFVRDAVYRLIARNRYRWFGKAEFCVLLGEDERRRLI